LGSASVAWMERSLRSTIQATLANFPAFEVITGQRGYLQFCISPYNVDTIMLKYFIQSNNWQKFNVCLRN